MFDSESFSLLDKEKQREVLFSHLFFIGFTLLIFGIVNAKAGVIWASVAVFLLDIVVGFIAEVAVADSLDDDDTYPYFMAALSVGLSLIGFVIYKLLVVYAHSQLHFAIIPFAILTFIEIGLRYEHARYGCRKIIHDSHHISDECLAFFWF